MSERDFEPDENATPPEPDAKEIAGPDLARIRNPWQDFSISSYDVADVRYMLDQARNGYPFEFLEYAEQILERDAHVRSVWQARVEACVATPVVVEPSEQTEEAEAIAERLRVEVVDTKEFKTLRRALLDGIWRGYSLVEVLWEGIDWRPTFKHRPPQWFVFDRATGRTPLLRTPDQHQSKDQPGELDGGVPLQPGHWIYHAPANKIGLPVRSGVAWPVIGLHLVSSFVLRYWARHAELYGIPLRTVQLAESTMASQKAELVSILQDMGSDGVAVLPYGIELDVADAKGEGEAEYFDAFLRWLNQEKSKAILLQTMTSEDGSSLAQAQVHDDVRLMLRDADCADLDDTINDQLVAWWTLIHYGPETAPPVIRSDVSRAKDITAIANGIARLSEAAGAALPITLYAALDILGIEHPEEGDMLIDGRVWGPDGPEGVAEDEAREERSIERMQEMAPDEDGDEDDDANEDAGSSDEDEGDDGE